MLRRWSGRLEYGITKWFTATPRTQLDIFIRLFSLRYILTIKGTYLPARLLTALLLSRAAAQVVPLLSWGACRSTCAWQSMHCNETAMELLAANGNNCMQVSKGLFPFYSVSSESSSSTSSGGGYAVCEAQDSLAAAILVRPSTGAALSACDHVSAAGWQTVCACSRGLRDASRAAGALTAEGCGLSSAWERVYAAPGYGVWLTLQSFAWATLLGVTALLLARADPSPKGLSSRVGGRVVPLAAGTALLLRLLVLCAWWDDIESFACAEVRHEVRAVWPLTRSSLDFVEAFSAVCLLGLLSALPGAAMDGWQGIVLGPGTALAGLLCIGDEAGVGQLQRSSRSLLMAVGALMLLLGLRAALLLPRRAGEQQSRPQPMSSHQPGQDMGQGPSRGIFVALAAVVAVGTIYTLNLAFTLSADGAYPYIILRSVILDVCQWLAVAAAATVLLPFPRNEYLPVSISEGDCSRGSWRSALADWRGWGTVALQPRPGGNEGSGHSDSMGRVDEDPFPADQGRQGGNVDGPRRSVHSSCSDDIEELVRFNFAAEVDSPSPSPESNSPSALSCSAFGEDMDMDASCSSVSSSMLVPVSVRYDSSSPPVAI